MNEVKYMNQFRRDKKDEIVENKEHKTQRDKMKDNILVNVYVLI